MNTVRIPPALKEAIQKEELVVFIGAGISHNLLNKQGQKLEGWQNMVFKLLSYLKDSGYKVDSLIGLVGDYEPIKVLDLLESRNDIPKRVLRNFLCDFYDISVDQNNFDVYKSIYSLSKRIITTNYDRAFEIAVSELNKNTAYKGKNYELSTSLRTKEPFLLKLHGSQESVDTMVVLPSDYQKLYDSKSSDSEHTLLVFRNLILNNTVLFFRHGAWGLPDK